MIDLKIESASNALKLLEQGWPTRAVSLVGDDLRFPLPRFGDHHLIVEFHDVEDPSLTNYTAPSSEQLAAVLAHAAASSLPCRQEPVSRHGHWDTDQKRRATS